MGLFFGGSGGGFDEYCMVEFIPLVVNDGLKKSKESLWNVCDVACALMLGGETPDVLFFGGSGGGADMISSFLDVTE